LKKSAIGETTLQYQNHWFP